MEELSPTAVRSKVLDDEEEAVCGEGDDSDLIQKMVDRARGGGYDRRTSADAERWCTKEDIEAGVQRACSGGGSCRESNAVESEDESELEAQEEAEREQERLFLHLRMGLKRSPDSSTTSTTILVVGGGGGMGDIVGVARAVLQVMCECMGAGAHADAQAIVVCGTNAAAKETLEGNWSRWVGPEGSQALMGKVHIIGFATNMDELMRASHIIVTKAGPGTIAEACICGLPIMISGFLPGQEEGNVSHVVEGRMGCFCKDTAMLTANLTEWLSRPGMLKSMSKAARRAGRPSASLDIAQDILQIMKRHSRNNARCEQGTGREADVMLVDAESQASGDAQNVLKYPSFAEFVDADGLASDEAAARDEHITSL